ncbi:hypothetical protein MKR66_18110 [Acinetobacter baumannii]
MEQKSGEVDLKIKVELMNDHDDEKLFFVRMGFVNDLKVEINNKANNFDIFSLYKLDDFNSEPTENKLENNFFEQFFGESFCSNYSMLNYLHQGQSQFIFFEKITDRKKALEELIKTTEIKKRIDICNKVESKLTKQEKVQKVEIDEIDAKLKISWKKIFLKMNMMLYIKKYLHKEHLQNGMMKKFFTRG